MSKRLEMGLDEVGTVGTDRNTANAMNLDSIAVNSNRSNRVPTRNPLRFTAGWKVGNVGRHFHYF